MSLNELEDAGTFVSLSNAKFTWTEHLQDQMKSTAFKATFQITVMEKFCGIKGKTFSFLVRLFSRDVYWQEPGDTICITIQNGRYGILPYHEEDYIS